MNSLQNHTGWVKNVPSDQMGHYYFVGSQFTRNVAAMETMSFLQLGRLVALSYTRWSWIAFI